MRARYNVKGAEEFRYLGERCKDLGGLDFTRDTVVEGILEDAAQPILRDMRAKVASRSKRATGNLAKSLTYRVDSGIYQVALKFGWSKITVISQRRNGSNGRARSTATYGGVLEFSEKRQVRHMYDTFDEHRDSASAEIARKMDEYIADKLR